ncbi:unnamed protein product [Callosobruchus maculatus]|uniref:Uncharacterized protein n=1 Tax=Callosobruchus maculatus TaxID=64391 RepID=A0A653CWT1_CALMS|nr:unnamed protein product [Callosobruchus maculatus]
MSFVYKKVKESNLSAQTWTQVMVFKSGNLLHYDCRQ